MSEDYDGPDDFASLSDDTPKMRALRDELTKIAATATEEDKKQVEDFRRSGIGTRRMKLSPAACAFIALNYNTVNRDLSPSKVEEFIEDMKAGDWKFHHQGIAATGKGLLGDGQHRIIAGALSAHGLDILVTSDFDLDAIDAIDRSKRRSAAQAMTMRGIHDAKAKATVMKGALEYLGKVEHGLKPRISDQKLEREVKAHESTLNDALHIGRSSTQNVTDPCINAMDASTWSGISLLAGWDRSMVMAFLAALQQGIATYTNSPTLVLSKALMRAKLSEKRKDRLTPTERLALTVKAARLWSQHVGVARLTWDERREGFPDPRYQPEQATILPVAAE